MVDIGARLREERRRLGYNQTDFSALGKVAKRAQVRYESGERSPDLEYLAGIASAGADVHYITTGQRSVGSVPPWKDSRSDEALRHAVSEAPNPYTAFEIMKGIRDATDLLQRLQAKMGYDLPVAWALTLQELLATGQVSEAGTRRVIELLARLSPK